MAAQPSSKRVTTAPKGRPTRSRRYNPRRRAFGSTAQWIAAVAVLLVVLILVIIVFDDDAGTNGTTGTMAPVNQPSSVLSSSSVPLSPAA
jgi:hypothetical protein